MKQQLPGSTQSSIFCVRKFVRIFFISLLLIQAQSWGQTSTQNFGTGTGSQTSQTGSTAFIPNPTSGTTYARAGATAPNAPINLVTASNPLGTTGAYIKAVSSATASVTKVTPIAGYTTATEFYTKFKVLFGDASAGTTVTSGVWSFYQGAGANYTDNNDASSAQVFTGLRFTYGTAGALTLTYNNNGTYNSTGLTTSAFSQGTVYTIEIVGNNKTSGTISYAYNGGAQTVAVQKFDLYINGTLVGNDLTKGTLTAGASINATTFTGVNSTSNAANIFIDDVVIYNAVPSVIGATFPTVTTDAAPSVISETSATMGGNVTATGGSAITGNGIVYSATSVNSTPAIGGGGVTQLPTASPGTGTGTFSDATGSVLSPNTQYSYRAYATNAIGTSYGGASGITFYSLANVPGTPTVNNPTPSSLDIIISANSNPVSTQFAIQDASSLNYVQANGSLGASPVWQTVSAWGTKTITGLAPSTTYNFRVKARNDASTPVETAFSSSGSGTTSAALSPTITLSGALAAFATVALTPSASQVYTVAGTNLIDDITITPPSPFEISLDDVTWVSNPSTIVLAQSSGTVATTTIHVRYNPSIQGANSGSITHTSNTAPQQDQAVSGFALATEPTVQSTISFGAVTSNSIVVNFIGGNGSGRIVKINSSNSFSAPTDGSTPSANSVYSSGEQVIYSSTGNSVTVTNLSSSTLYYFSVYEYNGSGTATNYFTVSPGTGNQTTFAVEPTSASNITFSSCSSTNSLSVTFSGGNGTNRIVVLRAGSAVSFTPVDGIAPSGVNSDFSLAADQGSGNKIVASSGATNLSVTGLAAGTTYFMNVFEYNGTGATTNYLTSTIGSGSTTTAGPLSYSTTGSTYTQNFNGLPTSGTLSTSGNGPYYLSANPVCTSSSSGWQFLRVAGSTTTAVFRADNGGNNSGAAFSYGTGTTTDRAFGALTSGANTDRIGLVIANNTPDILSNITISYTGEQWRNGGSGVANILRFYYAVGASDISTTGTNVSTLDFNSPIVSTTLNLGALDGNVAANRTLIPAQTFTLNGNWMPGQNLVIYWDDIKPSGSADGLAIDDFSFSALPTTAPTQQDSSITFSGISTVTTTANWLKGNGTGRIVVMNNINSFTNPVDGATYTANTTYVGTGEQVIYNGTGNSVSVTGLSAGTTYYYRVFAYNGTGAGIKYSTATALNNPNSQITNPPSAATKLAIKKINGSVTPTDVVAGKPFTVFIESQDINSNPQNVGANTTIDLSVWNGLGLLVGNISGIIQAGYDTVTIGGVIYDTPELGVQLNATASAGDILSDGQSASFDVLDTASQLAFSNVPVTAIKDSLLSSFSVRGLRADATLDIYYTGAITISKVSGPGNLLGTLLQNAIGGIATFNTIKFDQTGTYVLRADAPGLNFATSITITITLLPTLTELVVPKFIGGTTTAGSNAAKTPFVVCVQIDNLVPNTLYDIKGGLDTVGDLSTSSYGRGSLWNGTSWNGSTFIDSSAFTANGSGSSGPVWIFIQPGTDVVFDPGNVSHLRLGFAIHGNALPASPNFIGTKTITTLDVGSAARTSATTDDGAFLKGTTVPCVYGKYVLIYDNTAGTGDPLFAYQVRPAVPVNATQSQLPSSINDVYMQSNTSVVGDYPAVIPIGANNPNGVRRVEARNSNNTIFSSTTDADGIWPSGANTTSIARRSVATLTTSDAGMNTVSISSISSTMETCVNTNDGTATVVATGNAPVTYSWNSAPVQTTATATGLASGNFTVTVSDASGCSTTASVTVSQPSASTITSSGSTTFCSGDSVTLTAGVGVSYLWSTGATTQSIVVKTAGSYTVTVDNGVGCTQTSLPVIVTVNTFLATGTVFSESMGAGTSGGVFVNTYTGWQNNSAPIVFSSTTTNQPDVRNTSPSSGYTGVSGSGNLFMGTSGSNARDFIISGINSLGLSNLVLSFGLLRDNTTNGLTVEVSSDGTIYTPLTITQPVTANVWTLVTASGSIPSTANLRIRFSKNSTTSFRVDDVKLTATSTIVSVTPAGPVIFCGSGSVTLSSNISTGNLWSPNSQTTQSISATSTGIYVDTVADGNGCKATSNPVSVSFVPIPNVTISSITNGCFGNNNGSAIASALNGTPPLNYSWNTSPVQTTSSATNLASGNYTVTVTDFNGCTASANAVIIAPSSIEETAATSSASVCQGSNTNLSATGPSTGTASYIENNTVSIPDFNTAGITSSIVVSGLNIATLSSNQIANVTIHNITHTFDGDLIIRLIAPDGKYLSLSKQRGSSGDNYINTVFTPSATTTIASGTVPFTGTFKVDTTASVTALSAFNIFNGENPNGTWRLFVSDNSALDTGSIKNWSITFNNPLNFSWTSTPVGFTSSIQNPGSVNPSSLGSGPVSYNVVASNSATGCSSASSITSVNILPNPTPVITGTLTYCTGGSTLLDAGAGYTSYLWSNNSTTETTSATAGTYSVLVADANGCLGISPDVTVTALPLVTPSVSIVSNAPNPVCPGTNATFTATPTNGGASPVYQWEKNGTNVGTNSSSYSDNTLVNGDVITCVMTSNETCPSPNTVTSNSISIVSNITQTIFTEDFEAATLGTSGTWGTSYFGTFTTFPYNWFSVQNGGYPITNNTMEIVDYTGSQIFFGYDNQGSPGFAPLISHQVNAAGLSNLQISYDWICGGEPNLDYGLLMYYYQGSWWNWGLPLQGQTTIQHIQNLPLPSFLNNSSFYIGWYFVSNQSVVNQPGLSLDNIVITGQTSIISTGNVSSPLCAGAGASIPYSVCGAYSSGNVFTAQLSDATGSFANPVNIGTLSSTTSGTINAIIPSNISNGSGYRVRVISSNPAITGSDNGTNINIVNTSITPSGAVTFCSGGSVTLTATSGTTYLWSTGATTQGITVTSSGSYSVTVSGCISNTPITVTVTPAPSTPVASVTSQPSCTVSTGTITITSPTGVGITYSIDGSNYINSTGIFSGVSAGTYSVTAKNSDGCISSTAMVTVNPQPQTPAAPIAGVTTQPSCTVSTGTITITAPTGAGMTYSIDGSTYINTTGIFSGVATGTYSVTAKNSDGCISSSSSVTVNAQPQTPAAPIASVTAQPSCTVSTGIITITAPTGAGMTYSLNGTTYINTNGIFTGVAPGTSSVTAKNSDGCISPASSVTVNAQPQTPAVPVVSVTSQPTCSVSTGTITISSPTGSGMTYSIDGINYSNTSGIFSGIASGTYSVTAKNGDGCISSSASVTINAQPSTPTIVITDPGAVCSPATVDITVASITSGSTPGLIYTYWTDALATNVYATPTASSAGIYYIKGTNGSGCYDIKPVNVTVNISPTPIITAYSPAVSQTSFLVVDLPPVNNTHNPAEDYWIDGNETPTLTLVRGVTYTFNILTGNIHRFYLTTNAVGGLNGTDPNEIPGTMITGNEPLTVPLTFTPDGTTPDTIYYQCDHHQYMGGMIKIVNQSVYTSGPVNLCSGSNIMLVASGGDINATYTWVDNNMNPVGNTDTIIVSPTVNTNYTVTIANTNGCSGTGSMQINVVTCGGGATLNLKAFIQGYYLGGGMMTQVLFNEGIDPDPLSTLVDTIIVELHDQVDPTIVVASSQALLHTDGTTAVTFPGTVTGGSYYIGVRTRNAIQTCSTNPVLINPVSSYDFTTAASQALGDNQVDGMVALGNPAEGIYSFYSGDMNQDGFIDVFDFPQYDADNLNQLFGYMVTDLNGDGFVDVFDFPVYDQNNLLQVGAILLW